MKALELVGMRNAPSAHISCSYGNTHGRESIMAWAGALKDVTSIGLWSYMLSLYYAIYARRMLHVFAESPKLETKRYYTGNLLETVDGSLQGQGEGMVLI